MLAPNLPKSELRQALIQLMDELPSDRLAQVVDFALFVKTLNDRGYHSARTAEQVEVIEHLFSGPRHTGLYAALMHDRAEERAREDKRPS